ncbi:class II fumarate hydratase [Acidomonas methanolica]|uniref:Fumarate hydratase class II n=1 Tax=Acidomonas methanolica NBRC 104435 TaxID=1231351 RepID=A0A023D8R2_ACIMT|nr:class II fumarate hydratase [Acidomonas methanolica]MBU2655146.1 class II fumarate hydratase [Acidomonas methanolica]TCS25183.1 fumarase class II [Acidomonas methanolica]GAJ30120.1 fumarate hydratase [Acidomonas methanolica NBRC 104435]GBQ60753.1 fumarate hydratase [Acidomonas methanolica]GEK99678.1 fumarate hydratase class II 2 [Acidomonas methanolica NBRC 104435]
MSDTRIESDGMGEIEIANDKLWGAQTQRSLHYFSIGHDLMPREMVEALTIVKRASAEANHQSGRLGDTQYKLILEAADEILAGKHADMFPLHVWMTGSGTQFNMNVNEVIANRASQIAGEALGSKKPVHPNDHVNMSQSSNDAFPTAMYIAAALGVERMALPALRRLAEALEKKAEDWKDIVKIGRTHMQDAVPMTLGQEFHGFAGLIRENVARLETARKELYPLALGGTAVGTGINTDAPFATRACAEIARLTKLPFTSGDNKFALMGSHDALVHLSGALRTTANALYKIANDIRLLGCGPRAGFAELHLPENEPGSSIMPGKVNPTQAEALAMLAIQIMSNDVAVGFGGASGLLQMNVYKPLMIHNIMQSLTLLHDGCDNFRKFMLEGATPNLKRIERYVAESVMLVTALAPTIGYDKASKVAHYAMDHDTTLRDAALKLDAISAEEFDRLVDPRTMIGPNMKGK